ncbi:MAG: beta-N-acetylglucosaminidase domain-containing protein [Granulosicoccus sp.]
MSFRALPDERLVGYMEGYYGRLLDWQERHRLLQTLTEHGMNTWCYAPKEDACHRYRWRDAWDDDWHRQFTIFCRTAGEKEITVFAGIAPGLDFDYSTISDTAWGPPAKTDYNILLAKAQKLLHSGARGIILLMDDIDEKFAYRSGGFALEGEAHAALANKLGDDLDHALLVVPRAYANEIAKQSPDYLPAFAGTLLSHHAIAHCGSDIVSETITMQDCKVHLGDSKHRLVIWDNLYANDYCPRRLFVGSWAGRNEPYDVLLNPTGMVNTDQILLDLMAAGLSGLPTASKYETDKTWHAVMRRHNVPMEFDTLARWCWHPVFNSVIASNVDPDAIDQADIEAALDELLWCWKTPLAREWYPYLMGLRQDLLLVLDELPELRIHKTQTAPMATTLCRSAEYSR